MPPVATARVPGLDLLRTIAIVWVVFYHAGTLSLGSPLPAVTALGWMGVDLFFVLSGFLIARQWLRELSSGGSLASFYRRRAFRILPAYAVVVLVYFAWPEGREKASIAPLWQFLTFTENLFFDLSHGGKAFSHVWSLCVEEHFYLAFPVVAALLHRRSAWLVASCCLGVLVFGVAWRAHQWFDVVAVAAPELQAARFMEQIYYPTLPRLDGLLFGVALALVEARRPSVWAALQRRAWWVFGVGLLALGVASWLFDDRDAVSSIVGFPVVAFAMACLVAWGTTRTAPRPGASFIAGISYSVYLSHKLALHALSQLAGPWLTAHGAVAVVAYATMVVAVGAALSSGVEQPFLRLRARAALRVPLSPRGAANQA